MNRVARLTIATCSAACASVLTGVGIAAAHIESDPAAVAAGSTATVGFNVEHGCDGSNTTELQIKIPDGITDAQPVDLAGWTATAAADTVTFSGGDLDAETPAVFSVTFTAPATPGTIYFPIVQTCAVGQTAWIEIPAEGAADPDHPAPAVLVTDGPPTSADLAPHDDDAAEADDGATASTVSEGSTAPSTNATTAATTPTTDTSANDDDDSGNIGLVIGIVAGVVVVLGGAAIVAAKRKKS